MGVWADEVECRARTAMAHETALAGTFGRFRASHKIPSIQSTRNQTELVQFERQDMYRSKRMFLSNFRENGLAAQVVTTPNPRATNVQSTD
jgi:hypothetical protein